VRVDSLDEAIDLINANNYANGTALFSASGETARTFQRDVQVGMIGINVPIPVPMAFHSFGGWKASLFGDTAARIRPAASQPGTNAPCRPAKRCVTKRAPALLLALKNAPGFRPQGEAQRVRGGAWR
jgi:hypothetical protein